MVIVPTAITGVVHVVFEEIEPCTIGNLDSLPTPTAYHAFVTLTTSGLQAPYKLIAA